MLKLVIWRLVDEWKLRGGIGWNIPGLTSMSYIDKLKDPRLTIEDVDDIVESMEKRHGPRVKTLSSGK
jgi:hypothetical protein